MASTTRTNSISVNEYNKMSVKDRQEYLATLSRGEALELMRDVGYKEGFNDGVNMANNKVSLVDDYINKTTRYTWRNTIYVIGIILSFGVFIWKLIPVKWSVLFGAILVMQVFFILSRLLRKRE